MTPTSDERREVAKRLRHASHTDANLDVTIAIAILETVGEVHRPIAAVVADLIDPTCRMTNTSSCNGLGMWGCVCSACGANIEYLRAKSINYCPHCGARVVND